MSKSVVNPMSAIFKYLAISILFMFVGYLVGVMFVPPSFVYMANMLVSFLMIALLILAICSRKGIIPRRFSMNYVYAFTFIDGILLYPTLQYYLQDLGSTVFISVLLSTIALFGVLAMISNKREAGHFFGLGKMLFVGLIGMLIASVVNIFIGGGVNTFSIAISVVGVIIFSGYILYDISLIKYDIEYGGISDRNDLSIHVLNLYLDFINILLNLLNIASKLDD